MDALQLQVKFYVEDASGLALNEFIPVFHRLIQTHALDELLIDVADYSHVHRGPGVLLVCEAANYFMDASDGRLGLLYAGKRGAAGSFGGRIAAAFRSALAACRKLEEDPSLAGRIRFRGDETLFRIANRLLAPNTDETFERVKPELERFLRRLHPGATVTLERRKDARSLFAVTVRAPAGADSATLLSRLAEAPTRVNAGA